MRRFATPGLAALFVAACGLTVPELPAAGDGPPDATVGGDASGALPDAAAGGDASGADGTAPKGDGGGADVDATSDASALDAGQDAGPPCQTTPGKCPIGAACASHEDCSAGSVCDGATKKCAIPASCKALLDARRATASGVRTLRTDSSTQPFDAYCEMVADGGGWTLALKADGAKPTFVYDAALWENGAPFNGNSPGVDRTEAKLASFLETGFYDLRVVFAVDGVTKAVVVAGVGAGRTLHQQVLDKTGFGVPNADRWKQAIPNAALQPVACSEGFSRTAGNATARVRLGVLADDSQPCSVPDSWIGVGGNPNCLGAKATSGNVACYLPNAMSDRNIPAFATVYVR